MAEPEAARLRAGAVPGRAHEEALGGTLVKTHLFAAAAAAALTVSMTSAAFASCESGEIVVKFAHVVAAKGSPKGETAPALAARVNAELTGQRCMQCSPTSTEKRRVGQEGVS